MKGLQPLLKGVRIPVGHHSWRSVSGKHWKRTLQILGRRKIYLLQTIVFPGRQKSRFHGRQEMYRRGLRIILGRQKRVPQCMIPANTCWGSYAREGVTDGQVSLAHFDTRPDTHLFILKVSRDDGVMGECACLPGCQRRKPLMHAVPPTSLPGRGARLDTFPDALHVVDRRGGTDRMPWPPITRVALLWHTSC